MFEDLQATQTSYCIQQFWDIAALSASVESSVLYSLLVQWHKSLAQIYDA